MSMPNISASANASAMLGPLPEAVNGASSPSNIATWATPPSSDGSHSGSHKVATDKAAASGASSAWQEETCEGELSTGTWGAFGGRPTW
jgi:hypothetical protein